MKPLPEILKDLKVSPHLEPDVKRIYDELSTLVKRSPSEARMLASIFIALNENSVLRSLHAIANASGITSEFKKKMMKKAAWTLISKYMETKNIKSFTRSINESKIVEYLKSHGVSEEVAISTLELFKLMKSKIQKKAPQTSVILAACLYVSAMIHQDRITTKRAAEIFGVTKQAIRKWSRLIMETASAT